ncbi:Insulin-like growth factor binding protein, N-terminal [Pseudocohnilembus persalinus]|uniref:Insulin-like growth factor binding protein, N-terminal n=1 Tax=Pseudocohnilembus persalinus TaxID=266149 RepID=A0A0V0QUE7_PSEPJ|nr:Insulin-like growth factor binding protein, N-terminal [Pseudocohnilembus persalinus]|eukprot:KRX05980.1 Insulin-like growth factor binding protein, N-terminal [Pseudocohnilembus persalinus]
MAKHQIIIPPECKQNLCMQCPYRCKTCVNEKQCEQCTPPRTGDLCECDSGYFENLNLQCQLCNKPCTECVNQPFQCTQCQEGFELVSDQNYCKKNNDEQILLITILTAIFSILLIIFAYLLFRIIRTRRRLRVMELYKKMKNSLLQSQYN